MPAMKIPPLREADVPRKYKLAKPELGLEAVVKRLEKALSQPIDTRRPRFPAVGEEIAHKIRR